MYTTLTFTHSARIAIHSLTFIFIRFTPKRRNTRTVVLSRIFFYRSISAPSAVLWPRRPRLPSPSWSRGGWVVSRSRSLRIPHPIWPPPVPPSFGPPNCADKAGPPFASDATRLPRRQCGLTPTRTCVTPHKPFGHAAGRAAIVILSARMSLSVP